MKQKLNLSLSIWEIKCFAGHDIYLPSDQEYTLTINYPLQEKYTHSFKTGKGMGLVPVLKQIYKAYQKIYKSPNKYGVYGHDITDLCLTQIKVDHNKKTIQINVDS